MSPPDRIEDASAANDPGRAWWWRWGLPLAVVTAVGLAVVAIHRDPLGGPPGAAAFDAALFEPVAGTPGAPPHRVDLPHVWSDEPAALTRGRYRLGVELGDPDGGPLALYVPGVNTRAHVSVNGHDVGDADATAGLASRHWLVPLYRSISSALLVPGPDRVDLEVEAVDPGTGFLGPVYVGPADALRPAFEWRRFLQVTSIQVLVIAMVSLGIFLAGLTLLRRRDTSYLWFAVVLWIFAFGFWNLLAIDMRIPKPPYRWVGAVTMAWLVAAMTVFVNRILDERQPRREALYWGVALAGSAYFAATLETRAYDLAIPVWGGAVLVAGALLAWRVARRHVLRPGLESSVLVTCGGLILAAGVHDVGLVNGAFGVAHDFAIQYAAAASMALFAFFFVKRFVDALDTSEALTAELSERVRQKAAELEAGHARLRVLEREQAVASERERILAEIHDGLGSQLVSALALVRGGDGDADETADAIQSALDDMRLMIDSLDDVEGDLGTLLGSLRQRIGRRLERGGVKLDWRIADTPPPEGFGPEAGLHVLRIAQEAMANVVKHAGASTLTVSTRVDGAGAGRRVVLEIADDGRGFDPGAGGAGRGVEHMRRRARTIGATLEIASTNAGTVIRLEMPAPAPAPARGAD